MSTYKRQRSKSKTQLTHDASVRGPSFGFACLEGTASPLEDEKWLALEPVWQTYQASVAVKKLRKLSHQLLL